LLAKFKLVPAQEKLRLFSRGPKLNSMFCWSHNEDSSRLTEVKPDKLKNLESFYKDIDIFVIDEVNAMAAACLALLDQTTTAIFSPQHKTSSKMLPFRIKKMFLGDLTQVHPIGKAAIYDDRISKTVSTKSLMCQIQKWSIIVQLECGQMPNVMVALPNTGGALCSTPQSLADAHNWSAVQ